MLMADKSKCFFAKCIHIKKLYRNKLYIAGKVFFFYLLIEM